MRATEAAAGAGVKRPPLVPEEVQEQPESALKQVAAEAGVDPRPEVGGERPEVGPVAVVVEVAAAAAVK